MSLASDEDIRTAAPVIEPLLQLAGSPGLAWSTGPGRDGYSVSEIPSAPELGIPFRCFRTQFVIHTDVETFARTVVCQDAVLECDSTLKEIRMLCTDHCNSLLYTAYTSPSPWLISPRDFCVMSASVLTTPEQLRRICPDAPATLFPGYLRETAAVTSGGNDGSTFTNMIFVQNSRSTTSPLCPPPIAGDGGTTYIRGFVHCYGYIAWADAKQANRLNVTNFCCVDACGHIPKWLMAAAVNQNTQKLKRIAQLAEETARQRRGALPTLPVALDKHREREEQSNTPALQRQQPQSSSQPPLGVTAVASSSPQQTGETHGADPLRSSGSLNATLKNLLNTLPRQLSANDDFSDEAAPLDVQTSVTTMSALTKALSTTPPRSCPPSTPPGTPLAKLLLPEHHSTAKDTTPLQEEEEQQQWQKQARHQRGLLDMMVEPLAQLARAHGWHALREIDSVEYAELRSLPSSLRTNDGLCVALRVRTSMNCSLDTVEEILRSPAWSPEIDPELVRLVAAPSLYHDGNSLLSPSHLYSSPYSSKTSPIVHRGISIAERASSATDSAATALPHRHPAAVASIHLRDFRFNAEPPFTHAWGMSLCCTEGELNPYESGHLGFHAPGVPASTYVWIGSSIDGSRDVDISSRIRSPSFQHMDVRVFGVVAVAIPRFAAVVRVTHYVLFENPTHAPSSQFVHRTDSRFAVKGKKQVSATFLNAVSLWMGERMCRLRSMCESQQLRRTRNAMAPLDGEPLLRYMYSVHCAQQTATPKGTPRRLGDVVLRCGELTISGTQAALSSVSQDHTSSPGAAAAAPPLYTFTLRFPCTLRHLLSYMKATSVRSRYTLSNNVVFYEELASPPGFSAIHLGVCEDDSGACRPTSFSFLETYGLLCGHGVPQPTLVVSRANCDRMRRTLVEVDGARAHKCTNAFVDIDADKQTVHTGRIYCSGWVATSLDNGSAAEKDDFDGEESNCLSSFISSAPPPCYTSNPNSSGQKREMVRRVTAVARKDLGTSPTHKRSTQEEPASGPTAPNSIIVTQYSCVKVESLSSLVANVAEDRDLSLSRVEMEALLLQRFRDAVCTWRPS